MSNQAAQASGGPKDTSKEAPGPTNDRGRYGDLQVEKYKLHEAQKKVAAQEKMNENRRLDLEDRLAEIQELQEDIDRREQDLRDGTLTEAERTDCERALTATKGDKKRAQLLLKVANDKWKRSAESEEVALNAIDKRVLAGKHAEAVTRCQKEEREEENPELAGQRRRQRQTDYSRNLSAWNHRVYEERMQRRQQREDELQRQPTWARNQGQSPGAGGGGLNSTGCLPNKSKADANASTLAALEARPAFGEKQMSPEVGKRQAAMRDFSSRLPSPMITKMAGFGDGSLKLNDVSEVLRSPSHARQANKTSPNINNNGNAGAGGSGDQSGQFANENGDDMASFSASGALLSSGNFGSPLLSQTRSRNTGGDDLVGVSTISLDHAEITSLNESVMATAAAGGGNSSYQMLSDGGEDGETTGDLFQYTLRLNKAAILHMSALRHTRAKKCLDEANRLTSPAYLAHLCLMQQQQQQEQQDSNNRLVYNPDRPVPPFPGEEVDLDDPLQAPMGFPSYRMALEVRATTFNNLGCLHKVATHAVDALMALEHCMACEERLGVLSGRTLLNLGNVLTLAGRHEDAMLASRRAVQLLSGANNQNAKLERERRARNRSQRIQQSGASNNNNVTTAGDPDLETAGGGGGVPPTTEEIEDEQYSLQGVALETLVLSHSRQKKTQPPQRRKLPPLQ